MRFLSLSCCTIIASVRVLNLLFRKDVKKWNRSDISLSIVVLGNLCRNVVIGCDLKLAVFEDTFLQGHFVGRCFDKLLWRARKWKRFVHLFCNETLSSLDFFLFGMLIFLFLGAIFFQCSKLNFCFFVNKRKPAKNKVRLISRSTSSRFWQPDSFNNALSWFGRIPKTPRKQGCWFALRISSVARDEIELEISSGVWGQKCHRNVV